MATEQELDVIIEDEDEELLDISEENNEEILTDILDENNETDIELRGEAVIIAPTDYETLSNKPSINGHELSGDLSTDDLELDIPENTSDLNNDGDGASPFATREYVNSHGGKIDSISVNGVTQEISNKNVDLDVPTKLSELANDENFVSDSNYVHTDSNFTVNEKNKLESVEPGAQVNVKPDWAAASGSVSEILNKPDIPENTSDLNNDSNFVSDSNYVHTDSNFTVNEKNKLAGIESGAEENVIATITVNSVAQTPTNKVVNVEVPTKMTDLNNNAGFITNSVANLINYYTKRQIGNLLDEIPRFAIEVVHELPVKDISPTTIYLLKTGTKPTEMFDEYIYVEDKINSWEKLGKPIDLSDYVTQQWVNNQGFLTSHQSLAGYATQQWVNNQGFLTSHQSLEGYATQQWVNSQGFLTSHQSLANYYTKTEIDTMIGDIESLLAEV